MVWSNYSLDDGCNIVSEAKGGYAPRCCCHDLRAQLARMREKMDLMMERLDAGLDQSGSGFIASLTMGQGKLVQILYLTQWSVSSWGLYLAQARKFRLILMGHALGTDHKHLSQPNLKPISWKVKMQARTFSVPLWTRVQS